MTEQLANFKVDFCELTQKTQFNRSLDRPSPWNNFAMNVGHRVYLPCPATHGATRVSSMVIMDLKKHHWECQHIPGPCSFSGRACLYSDKIVWLGMGNHAGERGTGGLLLSTFDLAMQEWSGLVAKGSPPRERYAFSCEMVEDRDRVLVFGGKGTLNESFNDVHLLDVQHSRWIQPVVRGSPPGRRGYCGSCVHDGVFYCYGGVEQHRYSDGVYVLRFSANDVVTWSKPKVVFDGITALPLSSFALVPFQGVLILCGGLGSGNRFLRIYDPKTGKVSEWHPEVPLRFAGFGSGISALSLEGGKVIGVFGVHASCNRYLRISYKD